MVWVSVLPALNLPAGRHCLLQPIWTVSYTLQHPDWIFCALYSMYCGLGSSQLLQLNGASSMFYIPLLDIYTLFFHEIDHDLYCCFHNLLGYYWDIRNKVTEESRRKRSYFWSLDETNIRNWKTEGRAGFRVLWRSDL